MRGDGQGDPTHVGQVEGAPKRSKSSGEQAVSPQTKPLGWTRDTAYLVGASRRSTGYRPLWFVGKVQGRREERETFFRSRDRMKALESEAQERWELKETAKVVGRLTPSEG
jgi:hypothetical protein